MLKEGITPIDIKRIFDKHDTKIEYLERLFTATNLYLTIPRSIVGIDSCIIDTWNYRVSKDILREMFFHSEKFLSGIECKNDIDFLIDDWNRNNLGVIEWPFSAANFDGYVARLNRRTEFSEEDKDNILAEEVIKFRRIKDINTKRNDYIESLIVFYNENIIPTFRHNRGLDYYINGEPFDQKVSRGVGKAFKDKFGDYYYNIAINHPELVAKSLYENQDEERFDDDPRIYVVYLDDDISSDTIEQAIIDTDFNNPIEIDFEYRHSNRNILFHRTHCYILLLHN